MSRYLNTSEVKDLFQKLCGKDLWVNCNVYDGQTGSWHDDCYVKIWQTGGQDFWYAYVFIEADAEGTILQWDEIENSFTCSSYAEADVLKNYDLLSTEEVIEALTGLGYEVL